MLNSWVTAADSFFPVFFNSNLALKLIGLFTEFLHTYQFFLLICQDTRTDCKLTNADHKLVREYTEFCTKWGKSVTGKVSKELWTQKCLFPDFCIHFTLCKMHTNVRHVSLLPLLLSSFQCLQSIGSISTWPRESQEAANRSTYIFEPLQHMEPGEGLCNLLCQFVVFPLEALFSNEHRLIKRKRVR